MPLSQRSYCGSLLPHEAIDAELCKYKFGSFTLNFDYLLNIFFSIYLDF